MDFTFTEEQDAVRELASQIFDGRATVDRIKEVEASDERIDRTLWAELAKANLLGISLPESVGGSGLGLIELALLCIEQGRRVAPVPLVPTLTAALAVAEFGTDAQQQGLLPGVVAGDAILASALAERGVNDPLATSVTATPDGDGWVLSGRKVSVPALPVADRVLVPARTGDDTLAVFVVDPAASGVTIEPAIVTNREKHGHLGLDGVRVERGDVLGDPAGGTSVTRWLTERVQVALCAVQLGVGEGALRMAADYTSQRHQFGKPLSTNQGVVLRAADCYIDLMAMRDTMWLAAWRLTAGYDARKEVLVAKWWAAEAGQRVVHSTQHLHGGMGADIDYPVHRYFLWGKQIEVMLGSASAQLARLGKAIAVQSEAAA